MQPFALVATLFFSASAFLDAQMMNVSLCSPAGVHASVLANAKAEAEFLFHSAGIRIMWIPCDDFSSLEATPLFIVRLRTDVSRQAAGSSSLDLMGKALLSSDGHGKFADAYIHSIQTNATLYGADAGALLGCVIAHELGHLLLGPGHAVNGVMRTGWRGEEARYVNKSWLKFSKSQAVRLRQELQSEIAADPRLPGQ